MTDTPKGYLSWTQLNLIEKSLFGYAKYYILGEKFPETPEILLGKKLAKSIELEDEDDLDYKKIKNLLPKFEKRELELWGNVAGVPIYGKLDGFDEKNLTIYEIKTGQNEWNEEVVKNHGQLDFYALLVYLNYGRLPDKIELLWFPTKRENNDLVIVGDVKKFTIKKDKSDLVKIGLRIVDAWEKIKKLYKEEKVV
jgi:hypothetical protein